MSALAVRPLQGSIGAEVAGIDLTKVDSDGQDELRSAWLEHLVLFFRDQPLTPGDFLAAATRFGQPVEYPFVPGLDGSAEIIEIKKLPDETVNFGGVWHSGTTYLDRPPMASILVVRVVSPSGGDTLLANQYAAYESLPPGLRSILDGLKAVNTSALADVSKTREDRRRDAGEAGYDRTIRRDDGRRESSPSRVPLRSSGEAGVHMSVRLGGRQHRDVGQPLCPTQPDERLSRVHAGNAPDHPCRRCAVLSLRPAELGYDDGIIGLKIAGVATWWKRTP